MHYTVVFIPYKSYGMMCIIFFYFFESKIIENLHLFDLSGYRNSDYAGEKVSPHKNDLNRYVRHEKTFNNSRTFDRNYEEPRFEAVSQPVEPVLVEKDGRSKVLASPPRIEEKYVTLERIDRPPGIISITAQFKNYRFT